MPLISLRCPNCGANLEFNEGTKFGFCMYCGNKVVLVEESRKVEVDDSSKVANWRKLCIEAFNHGEYEEAKAYANKILEVDFDDAIAKEIKNSIRNETFDIESNRPEESLMGRVETAVLAGKVIDYRHEPYDRAVAVDVLSRMSRLDSLRTNDQIAALYANACALTAMAILNEPDPYHILGMLESLKSMKQMLMTVSDRLDNKQSKLAKNQQIMAYDRNVSSLYVQLKYFRVSKDKSASDAIRARLVGDPRWSGAAARAADALMDTEPAKGSMITGNTACKGAKAFEEYVKVLCRRIHGYVRSVWQSTIISNACNQSGMPFESCPNCGAEIVPFNGESPKFCMHCGFRLASGDSSYAEPRSSGNPLYDRILSAINGGTVIDHRTEPYDRETAIDAFNRMARLDHIRSREQMSAHFSNACAVAAMVIANDPDPYLVNGMMGSLEAMEAKLVSERGMWQGPGPTAGKNQGIKSIGRNVSSLHAKLKGRSAAENRATADAARMRLSGDPAWKSVAERAADALMDTSEADEKSSLLFGKNVVCKGAKVFDEYVKVLCGRPDQ